MNKLISKNPVQRFKMGKQIQKAGLGDILKGVGDFVDSGAQYGSNLIKKIPGIGWAWGKYDNFVGSIVNPSRTPVSTNEMLKKAHIGKTIVNSIKPTTDTSSTGSTDSKPDVTKPATVAKTTITKPTTVTNNNGLKLFNKIGVDRTYTRANDRFANITQGQKDILKTLGISGNNALELQKSINSYLSKNGLGGIAEDNMWGGQSQAALDYILNSTDAGIQAPAALRKENLESVNYSTPVQVAPVVQIPEVIQAPTIQLNRKQTRQRMRDLGLNPYDYTGEQRRALRRFWNGDDSQDISFLRLRKGGLISKNPITRFKQRFV